MSGQRSQQAQDTPSLASRGVYELPFHGANGERILVAVDHRGRRLMEATIYRSMKDPGEITDLLRAVLEREDPPHIRAIR